MHLSASAIRPSRTWLAAFLVGSAAAWPVAGAAGPALAGGPAPANRQALAAGYRAGTSRPSTVQLPGPATAPASPPGREWPSFAYDPARHELVLFGGDTLGSSSPLGGLRGTWIRTGASWVRQHPASSPSARTGAALVYDPATRQLLLFGGSSPGGGVDNQTWIWTGRTWRQLHPHRSPRARKYADLVYDAASRQVILFGGAQAHLLFADTWAWTGRTWRQLRPATSPGPRAAGAMAYDAATRTVIQYGGFTSTFAVVTEMWSWNGKTWRGLHPAVTPGLVAAGWQAAYDPASRQLLLADTEVEPGQTLTWDWNGRSWRRLHPAASPPDRTFGAMTYDSAIRRVVLFGGSGPFSNDYHTGTWYWNGRSWSGRAPREPGTRQRTGEGRGSR